MDDRQEVAVDIEPLIALATGCLAGEGSADSELSVSFVTEDEIADLHQRYMDEEGPTDVLSFPLDDTDEDGVRVLGDVVVVPAVAARNNPYGPTRGDAPPARSRDPAPAGARPRARGRARGDVGDPGAVHGGDGAVTWLWVLVVFLVVLGTVPRRSPRPRSRG